MSGRNSFNKLSRREFIAISSAVAGALGLAQWKILSRKTPRAFKLNRKIPGSIKGASANIGHLIREAQQKNPANEVHTSTAIVGSGISALSAAWWLERNHSQDFLIFELEKNPGGNSQSDSNEVSRYPWGAHYLPLPTSQATYVTELLKEAGVLTGYDTRGLPIYKEEFLCHDPKERLFMEGVWQDSLIPGTGLDAESHAEILAFLKLVDEYKGKIGRDGRPAFTIPAELSSTDSAVRALDKISMAQFIRQRGFRSKPLLWYVDYCCRDDYGARADKISAWVGLQYFCARSGTASNAEENSVLTWPEGNGWLVDYYLQKTGDRLRPQSLVTNIRVFKDRAELDVLHTETRELTRIHCKQVIFAAPRFTAPYLIRDEVHQSPIRAPKIEYDPWMVANITLSEKPRGPGTPLSWDNVSYYSDSLGYVVANHQSLRRQETKTVVTLYWPLDTLDPKSARESALKRNHESWAEQIVGELDKLHNGIEPYIENVDVWLWGHAMARPAPGFLWGKERPEMQKSINGILHFAHSDMTGYSIFEEAQYWGILAAKKVLKASLG